MRRVTVSVPPSLAKRVEHISRATGLKVSQVFRVAVEEHLRLHYSDEQPPKVRPSVIWKVRGVSLPRGPSPTLRKGRVGEYQLVRLDQLPL